MSVTTSELEEAAELLREGSLVAFPTETVYGLGANAFDERAVARVFEAKGRPRFDPVICHVADVEAAAELVTDVPPAAQRLIERAWPGPLTVVLPKTPIVPDIVTAGLPTVAVRLPDHEIARELIRLAGVPIAAPSANRFGRVSPTSAEHVRREFGSHVKVLDGGPCRTGVESTVVSFATTPPRLLRPGGLPFEVVREVLGEVMVDVAGRHADPTEGLESPGRLTRHYAPSVPVRFAATEAAALALRDEHRGRRLGVLGVALSSALAERFDEVADLAPSGDLVEAAAALFTTLRRLEESNLDAVVAVRVPEVGLGRAINDRLMRAAAGAE